MDLLGGPGDGDVVRVTGTPLPGYVTYCRPSAGVAALVQQYQFRPALGPAYVLDRRTLRYVWQPVPPTMA